MKIKYIVLYFMLASICYYTCPKAGSAYHGVVHKKITSVAMTKAAVFKERLTDIGFYKGAEHELKGNLKDLTKIKDWIAYGSEWEDSILMNPLYYDPFGEQGIMWCHFYNPITKTGFFKNEDFIGESLVDRANNYGDNEWSYPVAKEFYYAALTGDSTEVLTRQINTQTMLHKQFFYV